MKTSGRENPNSRDRLRTEPSAWGGRSKPLSLMHTGWKVRNFSAGGEVFFLTFPFIELHRTTGWEIWRVFRRGLRERPGCSFCPLRLPETTGAQGKRPALNRSQTMALVDLI